MVSQYSGGRGEQICVSEKVPGQTGLHKETLSQKDKKNKKKNKLKKSFSGKNTRNVFLGESNYNEELFISDYLENSMHHNRIMEVEYRKNVCVL